MSDACGPFFTETSLRDFIRKGIDLVDIIDFGTNQGMLPDPSRISTEDYSLFLRLRTVRATLLGVLNELGKTPA